ncbi:Fc.00g049840.m01.CDS01 [Cosmosporella sp. VM-42]
MMCRFPQLPCICIGDSSGLQDTLFVLFRAQLNWGYNFPFLDFSPFDPNSLYGHCPPGSTGRLLRPVPVNSGFSNLGTGSSEEVDMFWRLFLQKSHSPTSPAVALVDSPFEAGEVESSGVDAMDSLACVDIGVEDELAVTDMPKLL